MPAVSEVGRGGRFNLNGSCKLQSVFETFIISTEVSSQRDWKWLALG
jgi:hypothetical protein